MNKLQLQHEVIRRKLWCDIWAKAFEAQDDRPADRDGLATFCADLALAEFDRRFKCDEE